MAKRKRLNPALYSRQFTTQSGDAGSVRDRPPIARVAAETATEAAFAEVANALTSAREEGRLIVKLRLDQIETGHLVRDRIAFDETEMAALKASIVARGQQVPVEVVPLGAEDDARYGLISGLRRVMALRETGAGEVLALIRHPKTSADAYLAMVEENEIRAGVSFYERARLASEAARMGLFETSQAAIAHLFAQASPAKRSKIGSFVRLHEALGAVLRFPSAIPERLGLALVAALDGDAQAAPHLAEALAAADAQNAAAERAALDTALAALSRQSMRGKTAADAPREIAKDVRMQVRQGRVVLSGPGVTDALQRDLEAWLVARTAKDGSR